MSKDRKPTQNQQLAAVRKEAFLEQFALVNNISLAARHAGVHRDTYYDWRKNDPDFRAAADAVEALHVDAARQEIYERALGIKTTAVIFRGEPIWRKDPRTGAVLLDDDFEPIALEMPINCPQSLFRYLEANAAEYRKEGGKLSVSVPGEGDEDRRITVTYVLPDGKTEADYQDGGRDPLD